MDYSTGRLGEGGADLGAAEIRFSGRLGASFVGFAMARARRLSLAGSIEDGDTSVLIAVQGPAALIDAFEITCSLGPIDARVDSWARTDLAPGAAPRKLGLSF